MNNGKFTLDELSGDREVVKNNQLINAHYKLSAGEQKLVLTLCSKIKSDDITFKEFELNAREFFELLGVKSWEHYNNLKVICNKLAGRVISIETGNGFRMFPWLHHVEYVNDSGKVLLQFHEELAPYLLYVKNNIYTKYKLGMVLTFKSEYTIRIYELMKQYFPRMNERTFDLEELRKKLGIDKKTYQRYGDFKKYVILRAQKEINEKSDIEIEFEEIKRGRKVIAINFIISKNLKTTMPIENWYDWKKYKAKSVEDLAEIFSDIIKEKYRADLPKSIAMMYSHNALLSTIFEIREGYYKKYKIDKPVRYFLKVLENKTNGK